ncbi:MULTISPECIES: hypothetical protein [Cupriavidus]
MQSKPNSMMWLGILCGLGALPMIGIALQKVAEGYGSDAFRFWFVGGSTALVGALAWWCGCALQVDAAEAQKCSAARQDGDEAIVVRDPEAPLH